MKTRRLVALFTLVLILSSTFGFVNAQDGLTIGAQVQAMTVGVEETTYEPVSYTHLTLPTTPYV